VGVRFSDPGLLRISNPADSPVLHAEANEKKRTRPWTSQFRGHTLTTQAYLTRLKASQEGQGGQRGGLANLLRRLIRVRAQDPGSPDSANTKLFVGNEWAEPQGAE